MRERVTHQEEILRTAHVIETFQTGLYKNADLFTKGFEDLLGSFFFESIAIEEAI